jgi:hypothetical protein
MGRSNQVLIDHYTKEWGGIQEILKDFKKYYLYCWMLSYVNTNNFKLEKSQKGLVAFKIEFDDIAVLDVISLYNQFLEEYRRLEGKMFDKKNVDIDVFLSNIKISHIGLYESDSEDFMISIKKERIRCYSSSHSRILFIEHIRKVILDIKNTNIVEWTEPITIEIEYSEMRDIKIDPKDLLKLLEKIDYDLPI